MAEQSTTVEKACTMLMQVGRCGSVGGRLVDLTAATGLSRQTALRILTALQAEGLVSVTTRRRYRLGPSTYQLGVSAPNPLDSLPQIIAEVRALAQATGDTAYLAMRQGDQVLYLAREEGAYPIRTHLVNVGDCRNLTETYGGIAIMSALSQAERTNLLERLQADPVWAGRRDAIQRVLEQSDRDGLVHGPHVVIDGISGMGMPVRIADGVPCFAVTLSAIDARLTEARFDELRAALAATVARINTLLVDWQGGHRTLP